MTQTRVEFEWDLASEMAAEVVANMDMSDERPEAAIPALLLAINTYARRVPALEEALIDASVDWLVDAAVGGEGNE
jgi:hypothetical protein